MQSIGADAVIDYTRDDFADSGSRYDVILDTAGNRELSVLRRALAPKGTLVIVGGEGGRASYSAASLEERSSASVSLFGSQKMKGFVAKENAGDLVALRDLIEAGKVTPLIDRTFLLGGGPGSDDVPPAGSRQEREDRYHHRSRSALELPTEPGVYLPLFAFETRLCLESFLDSYEGGVVSAKAMRFVLVLGAMLASAPYSRRPPRDQRNKRATYRRGR